MTAIFKHAMKLYDDYDEDAMWCYLNTLVMRGDIEEGTAEQIAYMIEMEG